MSTTIKYFYYKANFPSDFFLLIVTFGYLVALFSQSSRINSIDLQFHCFSYFLHLLRHFLLCLLSISTIVAYPYTIHVRNIHLRVHAPMSWPLWIQNLAKSSSFFQKFCYLYSIIFYHTPFDFYLPIIIMIMIIQKECNQITCLSNDRVLETCLFGLFWFHSLCT